MTDKGIDEAKVQRLAQAAAERAAKAAAARYAAMVRKYGEAWTARAEAIQLVYDAAVAELGEWKPGHNRQAIWREIGRMITLTDKSGAARRFVEMGELNLPPEPPKVARKPKVEVKVKRSKPEPQEDLDEAEA